MGSYAATEAALEKTHKSAEWKELARRNIFEDVFRARAVHEVPRSAHGGVQSVLRRDRPCQAKAMSIASAHRSRNRRDRRQSTLMLPAFTTFVHFAMSRAMKLENSSGVLCAASMPSLRSRSCTSDFLRMRATA